MYEEYRMSQVTFLSLVVLLVVVAPQGVHNFLEFDYFMIAAFDVQTLSMTKLNNPGTLDIMTKIIRRYDIMYLQAERESYERVDPLDTLLQSLNKGVTENETYKMFTSWNAGQTSHTTQQIFLFRGNVSLVRSFLYPDQKHKFVQPPLCVQFFSRDTEISLFSLIGAHISINNAYEELEALKEVYDLTRARFDSEDIMILGNLAASCNGIAQSELDTIQLRRYGYNWLIFDYMDTTINNTKCAFDRFVVTGHRLMHTIIRYSAGVFRFDMGYKIGQEQGLKISYNFPIEVWLKDKEPPTARYQDDPKEGSIDGSKEAEDNEDVPHMSQDLASDVDIISGNVVNISGNVLDDSGNDIDTNVDNNGDVDNNNGDDVDTSGNKNSNVNNKSSIIDNKKPLKFGEKGEVPAYHDDADKLDTFIRKHHLVVDKQTGTIVSTKETEEELKGNNKVPYEETEQEEPEDNENDVKDGFAPLILKYADEQNVFNVAPTITTGFTLFMVLCFCLLWFI